MNIGAGIGVGFQEQHSKAFRYSGSEACQNGSDVTPIIKIPGGTFSSSPAGLSINSSTGVIDVSASTVGSYTITYSIGPTIDTMNIVAADDSSFSYSASSFRQNASNPAPIITGISGGTFSAPTGIIFIDSGTNTNSSNGIINLSASTIGGPYTITYTSPGPCPTSSTFNVTVQVALSITYSAAAFCEDGGNTAAPTVVGDPGSGTFASTTGLTINSTTGVINTDTSTPDESTPYTVTYTASTGETASTSVTIKNLDNATFSYSSTSFCENASNQTPSITSPGGTFTSQDITFRTFQMQFEVASGVSKTISIPGVYGTSFTVNWGDGFTETSTGGANRTISHTYNDGTYSDVTNPTVSIGAESDTGAFTSFAFIGGGSRADLLDIPQWGSIVWSGSVSNMFNGCNNVNFQISATDYPDLTNITDMSFMFFNATHFNSNINHWDVSTITNMNGIFREADNFNQSLNSWDVSSVSNFSAAFASFAGVAVFNGNISSWDMSSCENTSNMFYNQTSFNQDISGWNFSNNWINANQMFINCSSFNQDLGSWNVGSVEDMSGMLRGCTNFNNNGATLSGWDVSSVLTMSRMFQSSTSFVGTGVNNWNPSSCRNFELMFYLTLFNENLSSWSLNSLLTTAASMLHPSSMSQANYTDTLVGWANTVYTNSAPYSVNFTGNSFSSKFDGTRSGGANFTTAQDAYNYLVGATASWSIN